MSTTLIGDLSRETGESWGRGHYENTPMQYTAIFRDVKMTIFRYFFFYYFHIFAQNIDCGYMLEPPQ